MLKWLRSHWFIYTFIRLMVGATIVAVIATLVGLKFMAVPGQNAQSAFVQVLGLAYMFVAYAMISIAFDSTRYAKQRRLFFEPYHRFFHLVVVEAPIAVASFFKTITGRSH